MVTLILFAEEMGNCGSEDQARSSVSVASVATSPMPPIPVAPVPAAVTTPLRGEVASSSNDPVPSHLVGTTPPVSETTNSSSSCGFVDVGMPAILFKGEMVSYSSVLHICNCVCPLA